MGVAIAHSLRKATQTVLHHAANFQQRHAICVGARHGVSNQESRRCPKEMYLLEVDEAFRVVKVGGWILP